MILDICIVLAATQAIDAHAVKEKFQFLVPTCARRACGNTNKYLNSHSNSSPGQQHGVSHYTGVSRDHSWFFPWHLTSLIEVNNWIQLLAPLQKSCHHFLCAINVSWHFWVLMPQCSALPFNHVRMKQFLFWHNCFIITLPESEEKAEVPKIWHISVFIYTQNREIIESKVMFLLFEKQ